MDTLSRAEAAADEVNLQLIRLDVSDLFYAYGVRSGAVYLVEDQSDSDPVLIDAPRTTAKLSTVSIPPIDWGSNRSLSNTAYLIECCCVEGGLL